MAKKAEIDTDDKLVKVNLFKDNGAYKDDVFVSVNGNNYLIQRGVDVEVPQYIADVLNNSLEQDARTANLIAAETAKYAAKN